MLSAKSFSRMGNICPIRPGKVFLVGKEGGYTVCASNVCDSLDVACKAVTVAPSAIEKESGDISGRIAESVIHVPADREVGPMITVFYIVGGKRIATR